MMKTMSSWKRVTFAPIGATLALLCSQASAETAYFSFVSTAGVRTAPHEFVFAVDDAATIAKLREIVINAGDIAPNNQRIAGQIAIHRVDYNAEWPFHLIPSTVRLTLGNDNETCDATPFMVEDNLQLVGQDFLPGAIWCPWSMRIVREVAPPR